MILKKKRNNYYILIQIFLLIKDMYLSKRIANLRKSWIITNNLIVIKIQKLDSKINIYYTINFFYLYNIEKYC